MWLPATPLEASRNSKLAKGGSSRLAKHFWKESLPKIVAKVWVLAGSVMKNKNTQHQSSTFHKHEGSLLQYKLVMHYGKESLPKSLAKVGALAGSVMKK